MQEVLKLSQFGRFDPGVAMITTDVDDPVREDDSRSVEVRWGSVYWCIVAGRVNHKRL